MKLIRFGHPGLEKPGIQLADSSRIDVSDFGEDFNEAFFGTDGVGRLRKWLETRKDSCPKVSRDTRLGPPMVRPSKIVCVGLNYAQHAKEAGMAIPKTRFIFKGNVCHCWPQ